MGFWRLFLQSTPSLPTHPLPNRGRDPAPSLFAEGDVGAGDAGAAAVGGAVTGAAGEVLGRSSSGCSGICAILRMERRSGPWPRQ